MEEYETTEELRCKILEVSRAYDHLIADLVKAVELRDTMIAEFLKDHSSARELVDKLRRALSSERERYLELIRERSGIRPTPPPEVLPAQPLTGLEASKKPGRYRAALTRVLSFLGRFNPRKG
jgi:hypothetical protein